MFRGASQCAVPCLRGHLGRRRASVHVAKMSRFGGKQYAITLMICTRFCVKVFFCPLAVHGPTAAMFASRDGCHGAVGISLRTDDNDNNNNKRPGDGRMTPQTRRCASEGRQVLREPIRTERAKQRRNVRAYRGNPLRTTFAVPFRVCCVTRYRLVALAHLQTMLCAPYHRVPLPVSLNVGAKPTAPRR